MVCWKREVVGCTASLNADWEQVCGVAVAWATQLAVAPVFLLSVIGPILAAMTSRLVRIIDRARVLENQLDAASRNLDGPSHMHGYPGVVPERLFALRRDHSRLTAVRRGNVDVLSRAALVSERNLCGHGEPSDRTSLNRGDPIVV